MASPACAGSVPGRIPTTFAARISSAAISTRILTRAPVVNDAGARAATRSFTAAAVVRPAGASRTSAVGRVSAADTRPTRAAVAGDVRSEEHTSELQSQFHLV